MKDVIESARIEGETRTENERKELVQTHTCLLSGLDGIDATIYIADLKTYELLFLNEYARNIWGDNVGKRCWETLQKDQSGPCPFCTNDRLLNKDGQPAPTIRYEFKNTVNGRWYDCHDKALTWPDGRMVRLEIATDITEKKLSERFFAVRAKLGEMRTLDDVIRCAIDEAETITGSSIGFFHFVDEDQEHLRLQSWSTNTMNNMCAVANKETHYPISKAGVWIDALRSKSPVIHNDYASLPHKKGLPNGHALVRRLLVVPSLQHDKVTCLLGVGNKLEDYTADDIKNVENLLSFAIDHITRKRAEEEMRAMEERAARAERIAAIARLGGGVAHEMNNVLNTIDLSAQQGLLDLDAMEETEHIASMKALFTNVRAGIERGSRVVESMRNLSSSGVKSKADRIDLAAVLADVVNLRKPELDRFAIAVRLDASDDCIVVGNADELSRLFMNMIINAVHAMIPHGGGLLRIAARREERTVVVEIIDDGVGMTEEVRSKIFLPFFSTKGAYAKDNMNIPGTGLGLSICSRIVEDHLGAITVRSTPEKGSAFTVRLPAMTESAEARPAADGAGVTARNFVSHNRALRILVVDDEELIASQLAKFLKARFPETGFALSGRAALEMIAKQMPDVIITDYIMPDMRADDLIAHLPSGIVTMLATGWIEFENDEERQSLYSKFHKVFQKPYELTEILSAIDELNT